MFTCLYEQGNIIFKEGDTGHSLFIIKSGEVICQSKNGEIKRVLHAKDFFGEYIVLFDILRSNSKNPGILPRTLKELFLILNNFSKCDYFESIRLSLTIIEIYHE